MLEAGPIRDGRRIQPCNPPGIASESAIACGAPNRRFDERAFAEIPRAIKVVVSNSRESLS
jgi:hypothetical protein